MTAACAKALNPPMNSELFISKSRKRLEDLIADECQDGANFLYQGKMIWDGF